MDASRRIQDFTFSYRGGGNGRGNHGFETTEHRGRGRILFRTARRWCRRGYEPVELSGGNHAVRATESDDRRAAGSFTEVRLLTKLDIRDRDERSKHAVSMARGRGTF